MMDMSDIFQENDSVTELRLLLPRIILKIDLILYLTITDLDGAELLVFLGVLDFSSGGLHLIEHLLPLKTVSSEVLCNLGHIRVP